MELLSPAGDLNKLKLAFQYGADAVYFGVGDFSLRAIKLGYDELKEGIEYAHNLGKKIYITANVFMHDADIEGFIEHFKKLSEYKPDGVIVSDIGAAALAQQYCPDIDLHISTQANITNWQSVLAYQKLGAKRVILARELTFAEIAEIKKNVPDIEIEVFVHGAMCVAYSGRCLLSQYLTARDANKGVCSQPCRWEYNLVSPDGIELKIAENRRGSYILNSKDLCLIDKLDKLREVGVDSIKIEGRNKSEYYVAAVTKAYRQAMDNGFTEELKEELEKVSHREYVEGDKLEQIYGTSSYQKTHDVVGMVIGYENGHAKIEQRNKIYFGDELEILMPKGDNIRIEKAEIKDEKFNDLESTPHATMIYYLPIDKEVPIGSFVRKVSHQ